MAQLIVVYWRDIPAQVIVRAGRKKAAQPLPERFEQAIDRAAMKTGAAETDAYLAEWRRADPVPVEGDDLAAIAEAEAARIVEAYPPEAVRILIDNGGHAA